MIGDDTGFNPIIFNLMPNFINVLPRDKQNRDEKDGFTTFVYISDNQNYKKDLKKITNNDLKKEYEEIKDNFDEYLDKHTNWVTSFGKNKKKFSDSEIIMNKKKQTYSEYLRDQNEKFYKERSLPWYKLLANDWLSQCYVLYMFCVNDILYLTGDTGVGKTSEAPKIILYGMNSLNMPYNRIVSTQPIKAPVKSPSRYSKRQVLIIIWIIKKMIIIIIYISSNMVNKNI